MSFLEEGLCACIAAKSTAGFHRYAIMAYRGCSPGHRGLRASGLPGLDIAPKCL